MLEGVENMLKTIKDKFYEELCSVLSIIEGYSFVKDKINSILKGGSEKSLINQKSEPF